MKKVRDYIIRNPGKTAFEISQATGVNGCLMTLLQKGLVRMEGKRPMVRWYYEEMKPIKFGEPEIN